MLNVLGVLSVLNVLNVLHVLNMPIDALLAYWAFFLSEAVKEDRRAILYCIES